MKKIRIFQLTTSVIFVLLMGSVAQATEEEKLYHKLLALKEKKIEQLERELITTRSKLRGLEQKVYGQAVTPAEFIPQENAVEVSENYHDFEENAHKAQLSLLAHNRRDVQTDYIATAMRRKPNDFEARPKDWQWRGSVEALYMKPRFQDLIFASLTDGVTSQGIKEIAFDYDYGAKAEFEAFTAKDWTFGLGASYLQGEEKASASGAIKAAPGFGTTAATDFTTANARAEFDLWRARVFYRRYYDFAPFALDVTPAIDFAYMDFEQDYHYAGNGNELTQKQKQRFIGAGPSVTARGSYAFNPYFTVDALLGASFLFGGHDTEFSGRQIGAVEHSTALTKIGEMSLMPVFSADLGVSWQHIQQGGRGYSVRLGYSFETMLGLDRPMRSDAAGSATNVGVKGREDRNVTFDGVRLELNSYW